MNGTSNNTDNFRKSDLSLRSRFLQTNNSHPCRTWFWLLTPQRVASSAPGVFGKTSSCCYVLEFEQAVVMAKKRLGLQAKLRSLRRSSQPTKEEPKPQQIGLATRSLRRSSQQEFGLPERWSSQLEWMAFEALKSTHHLLRSLSPTSPSLTRTTR